MQANAVRLPFTDGTFGETTAVAWYGFTESAVVTIASLARVTRTGGPLVLGALNPRSPWRLANRFRFIFPFRQARPSPQRARSGSLAHATVTSQPSRCRTHRELHRGCVGGDHWPSESVISSHPATGCSSSPGFPATIGSDESYGELAERAAPQQSVHRCRYGRNVNRVVWCSASEPMNWHAKNSMLSSQRRSRSRCDVPMSSLTPSTTLRIHPAALASL